MTAIVIIETLPDGQERVLEPCSHLEIIETLSDDLERVLQTKSGLVRPIVALRTDEALQ